MENLASFNLDVRLQGLTNKMGFNYSRYADDIAFSSTDSDAEQVARLINKVKEIAAFEGFCVHPDKTKVMLQSAAQQLTGMVINEKQNSKRENVKAFEAELFNCVRFGAASQNRQGLQNYRAHLQGRLAHFIQINPQKSQKLAALFDQIQW